MTSAERISFRLNGRAVAAEVGPAETAVDVLFRRFDLRGTRESCGQGLCGCCTIHVDGVAVSGCLTLAILLDDTEVTTVEGLQDGDALHPVQQAFLDAGAFQCGFCTPGFIMMVVDLLEEHPDPDDETVRDHLVGNLCRCSAYPEILDAVRLAAERMRGARVPR
jgi:carbon-monoxide dehydrogenase small subunit